MYSSSIFRAFLIFTSVVNGYAELIKGCPKLPFNCFCRVGQRSLPSVSVDCQRTNYVECRRTNYEQLRIVFKKCVQYKLIKFDISTSSLIEVNKTMFTNLTLNTLEFKSSKIETFRIFEGFSPLGGLYTLTIDNVEVKKWVFTPADEIAALRKMRHFVLMDCHGNFPHDIKIISFLPEKLESIKIRWCKLQSKDENSFSRFSNLKKLDLRNNNLRFFKRSYLPNPAHDLLEIILSHNPLTSLPNDMFEGMRNLKVIELERTHLTGFSYNTFYPVLGRKLFTLKITHNPLHCDCYNSWLMKEIPRWKMQMPTCYSPENLKNRKLDTFPPMEMCRQEGYEKTMEEYCATIAANESQTVTE